MQSIHNKNKKEIKFILVRHPFERLVSAFRDKIERNCNTAWQNPSYLSKLKKEITTKFRANYLQKFGANNLSKENKFGAIIPNEVHKCVRTAALPTFWEFIQWFLRDKNYLRNEHWAPVYDFCQICHTEYDYIFKFEEFGMKFQMFIFFCFNNFRFSFRYIKVY